MILQESKDPKKKRSKKRNPLVVGHTKGRKGLDKIESIGPPTQINGSLKKVPFLHLLALRIKIISLWQVLANGFHLRRNSFLGRVLIG